MCYLGGLFSYTSSDIFVHWTIYKNDTPESIVEQDSSKMHWLSSPHPWKGYVTYLILPSGFVASGWFDALVTNHGQRPVLILNYR